MIIGPPGPTGPAGPTGSTGPAGPAGPATTFTHEAIAPVDGVATFDMAAHVFKTLTLSGGDVEFSTTNVAAARLLWIFIKVDTSTDVTFNELWNFAGMDAPTGPMTLDSGTRWLMKITAYGTTDEETVIEFVQANFNIIS